MSTQQSPTGTASTPAATNGDLALLSAGTAPEFETHDDYTQVGVLSALNGCVSITTEGGDDILVFAPYGSKVTTDSPRVHIGNTTGDLGDQVELVGQTKDVYMPVGAAKPSAWRQCVGGRGAHQVMFVVGTP